MRTSSIAGVAPPPGVFTIRQTFVSSILSMAFGGPLEMRNAARLDIPLSRSDCIRDLEGSRMRPFGTESMSGINVLT